MESIAVSATVLTEKDSVNGIFIERNSIIEDWIFLATPVPILLTLFLYGLILYLGPRIMENREPYKLKTVMRFYNIFQVAHNMYMVYSYIENPQAIPLAIERACTPNGLVVDVTRALSHTYYYYSWNFLISKQIDLLDTVFMVLRKKNSHITFLHVYHHVAMVFFTWITLHYSKSPHALIPALINVIIHSIMYSYYFLATFNRLKRLLWWKQHLTKLQLGQFVIILTYIFLLYYNGCPISWSFTFTWTFNVFVFLILFINFYVKAYVLKSEGSDQKIYNERTKKSCD